MLRWFYQRYLVLLNVVGRGCRFCFELAGWNFGAGKGGSGGSEKLVLESAMRAGGSAHLKSKSHGLDALVVDRKLIRSIRDVLL
jgi:hypothetical protein